MRTSIICYAFALTSGSSCLFILQLEVRFILINTIVRYVLYVLYDMI